MLSRISQPILSPSYPVILMKHAILLTSIAAASLALTACATTSQNKVMDEAPQSSNTRISRGTFPFQGESLTFDARHVATRTSIADAVIQVGYESKMEDGTRYIPIVGEASSKSIVRLFARVDDRAEAYIDPDTWETIYSYKHMNENDRDREYYVWFWPDELSASVERHYKKNVVKREDALPEGTLDTLVWVYHTRAQKLEKGKSYISYSFDGWTINKIELNLVGQEDVWTENGFYPCNKFEIYRERSDAITPKGALSGVYIDPARVIKVKRYKLAEAWLATDELQTPVRLVINTGIGEFDLLLKAVAKIDKDAANP